MEFLGTILSKQSNETGTILPISPRHNSWTWHSILIRRYNSDTCLSESIPMHESLQIRGAKSVPCVLAPSFILLFRAGYFFRWIGTSCNEHRMCSDCATKSKLRFDVWSNLITLNGIIVSCRNSNPRTEAVLSDAISRTLMTVIIPVGLQRYYRIVSAKTCRASSAALRDLLQKGIFKQWKLRNSSPNFASI